jgi:putative flippase GtrA
VAELARFGSVGAMAYVVDLGLFNLLRFGPGELLAAKPLTAKAISVVVATVVAWLGNRYWTFAHRRTATRGRELAAFAVVNAGGLVIALSCLAFSHYVLGLRSPLADNIAANVVGLGLGTAFRYVLYRRLVFTAGSAAPVPDAARGDDGALRQDDVGVERPRDAGQEDREDGRAALGQLQPTAVGRDEVPREGETEARPGA